MGRGRQDFRLEKWNMSFALFNKPPVTTYDQFPYPFAWIRNLGHLTYHQFHSSVGLVFVETVRRH